MSSEIETAEQRLKSFMVQLQTECGILERIVYKHKNQHRRCSYFQYVLKVRRDLKLLKLADLEEIIDASFLVIIGNKPRQKVQLLESLKRRRCDGSKYNFLERLLGVARLLSQMVEPILKAAIEISTLLAQTYFMKFSLTALAILARVRVLVQQMLLDAVHVYNAVSSLSRTKQTIKINQEGCEVFRECYPQMEESAVMLDCIWQEDKYVLVEMNDKSEAKRLVKDNLEDELLKPSNIQYENIEASLEVDESGTIDIEQTDPGNTENISLRNGEKQVQVGSDSAGPSSSNVVLKEDISTNLLVGMITETDTEKMVEVDSCVGGLANGESISKEVGSSTNCRKSSLLKPVKLKNETKNVAFVSVKPPPSSTSNQLRFHLKGTEKSEGDDDPFFKLLTGGNQNNSLI